MNVTINKRACNYSTEMITELAKKHNTTYNVIELLLSRGYDVDSFSKLIQTTEFAPICYNDLTNTNEAILMISEHLENNNDIYVFADYDCDGIMSNTIMSTTLNALAGAINSTSTITCKIPNRHEGYGLSLDWCKKNFPNKVKAPALVITVDNGITKRTEVEYLKSVGVNVLITDHHMPIEGETPSCIVVDPHLNDLDNENALGLCGAAVALKICVSLLLGYGVEEDNDFIQSLLPYAAIATISDIMPVTEENISIIGRGLEIANTKDYASAIDYFLLYNNDNVKKPKLPKSKYNKKLNVKTIAFTLAPMINACGRMGNVQLAADYMLADDIEEKSDLFNQMSNLNDERKELERSIVEELLKNDYSEDYFIVEEIPNASGIGGTVATKLANHFGKPVIILSGTDSLHGSARSVLGLDLHELFSIEVERGNMIKFGGHKAAAGVAIDRTKLGRLKNSLNITMKSIFNELAETADTNQDLNIEVDNIITLAELNKSTADKYKDLIYFNSLHSPTFAIKNVNVYNLKQSKNNPNNVCFNFTDSSINLIENRYGKVVGKELWMWNSYDKYVELGMPNKVHLIGEIELDFMTGKSYILSISQIIPA